MRTNPYMLPVGTVLLFLPWFVLLGWLAEVSWFLTDDAFISFRYVRNLLEGHGLVFNHGERIEGYSNFLWVLELALLWGVFGLRPEYAAPWLSVAFTVGTIAVMLWWLIRLPAVQYRMLAGWIALGLVCSSATFAVWTSGGGLETRQFTFFVVMAVICLSLYRGSRYGLFAVSLSLAAAALTRPEGPMFAVCCFVWYAVQRRVDTGHWGGWRDAACLAIPFVVLVAGHYLFRYSYYGEWLPNTYYAKHVRPWYDMGLRYLWAAALETGLYLLLPLAVVSLIKRWRERRCLIYALPLLCIVSHAAYIARIGGDHFEYRPLDFYWPLLAVPAAEGIVGLGAMISERLRRGASDHWKRGACALLLFIPIVFYSNVIQGFLLIEKSTSSIFRETLDEESTGWLLLVPGMSILDTSIADLHKLFRRHWNAGRAAAHEEYTTRAIRDFRPYESVDWDMFPLDAVTSVTGAGILPFYAYGLTVIDEYGLNDATIARNPVSHPNHQRCIAHDRSPPSGYLEKRGVNFTVYPAASGERVEAFGARAEAFDARHAVKVGRQRCMALDHSPPSGYLEKQGVNFYAVKVGRDLWMPFDSPDHQWVVERFAGRELRIR